VLIRFSYRLPEHRKHFGVSADEGVAMAKAIMRKKCIVHLFFFQPFHRSAPPQKLREANVLSNDAKVVFNNPPAKFSVTIPRGTNVKLPLFNFLTFVFCLATEATNDDTFGFLFHAWKLHPLKCENMFDSPKRIAKFV
jgi:hypothetical protein